MCGIAGVAAGPAAHAPRLDGVRAMCDAIRHRGPDDAGFHCSEEAVLGMRRLAIIDPAHGAQPIYNETREVCAVVNGEIYNYRELRTRLEQRGHVFRAGSDVECVVHAYEEYGTACFAELRGMFAIAIWDARSHTLVLARDRFGKKPLFYMETPRGLLFASELKALLRYPGIDPEIDRTVAADFMLLGYVPTPRSIFDGVHKLEPAHFLVYHRGRVSSRSYWSLEYAPKLEFDERRLTDMLEAELDEAVRVRLNSDVPFGAFLSGGVDSSLVVAMMTRHLDAPVKTFSIGFEDARFDESADARRVASYLGTEHHELIVRPDAVELLESIAWYLDEPMADSSVIPTFLVSRLAAGHVKMVLTGDGGDEMFGGYKRYARYLQLVTMRKAGARSLAPLVQGALRRVPVPWRERVLRACDRLGMRHPDDYLAEMILGAPATVTRVLHADAVQAALARARSRTEWPGDAKLGPLDSVIRRDVRSYLLDDILVKVDRASMANSLEARAPLLDQQLAAFAARLPERFKVRGGTTKYLLKRVAERHLPADWIRRKKQGFAIPLAHWLRTDLRELLLDTVNSRAFAHRGILDPGAARQLASEHMNGTRDHAAVLWAMLVLETWAKRYRNGESLAETDTLTELRPAAI